VKPLSNLKVPKANKRTKKINLLELQLRRIVMKRRIKKMVIMMNQQLKMFLMERKLKRPKLFKLNLKQLNYPLNV
jgi:hypothetical protein